MLSFTVIVLETRQTSWSYTFNANGVTIVFALPRFALHVERYVATVTGWWQTSVPELCMTFHLSLSKNPSLSACNCQTVMCTCSKSLLQVVYFSILQIAEQFYPNNFGIDFTRIVLSHFTDLWAKPHLLELFWLIHMQDRVQRDVWTLRGNW